MMLGSPGSGRRRATLGMAAAPRLARRTPRAVLRSSRLWSTTARLGAGPIRHSMESIAFVGGSV